MHAVDFIGRDGRSVSLVLSRIRWEMLVEISESLSFTPADFCARVEAGRGDSPFADAFEADLYRYYKAKSPAVFTGMNDGDAADTRFEHGLQGVEKDKLFE